MDVAIGVFYSSIAACVVAWSLSKILLDKNLIVAPQAEHKRWWHRKLHHNLTKFAILALFIVLVEDLEVISWDRLGNRACLSWEDGAILLDVKKIASDWPCSFSLPPCVIDLGLG